MKRRNKMIILLVAICMLMTIALSSTAMADRQGWYSNGENWYYFDENGDYYEGWLQDGDDWYYLSVGSNGGRDGRMVHSGLIEIEWKYYLFEDSGKLVTEPGWNSIKINGKECWYYINPNATAKFGWVNENDAWYYIENTGVVFGEVALTNDGGYYYFEKNGKLSTKNGWIEIPFGSYHWDKLPMFSGASGEPSYFYLENGKCLEDEWVQIDGKWYYLQPDLIKNACPAFDKNYHRTGGVYAGGQLDDETNYYLFGSDYALITEPGWHQISGGWYYVRSDATCDYGWKELDGNWYYLMPRLAVNDIVGYDGKEYFFEDCICKGIVLNHFGPDPMEYIYFE